MIRSLRRMYGFWSVALLVMMIGMLTTTAAQQTPDPSPVSIYLPSIASTRPLQTYVPLIANGSRPQSHFGVHPHAPNTYNQFLAPLNVGWVRLVAPAWGEVESVKGQAYNWNVPSVRNIETALAGFQQDGIQARVILMALGGPAWATVDGSLCGPIKPEYYDDYARFMETLARRYSQIYYWELGNEPDVDVELVGPTSGFGCWGDKDDEFYGGRAYGEMLKTVYPALKQANPSAFVLNGGLLLDNAYDPSTGNHRPARFLEGVFETGAGASFDIVNYHGYTHFTAQVTTPDGAAAVGSGAVDWKARYLRQMMERYGVAEKPLINTETALLCRVGVQQLDACRNAQANNVGRVYARAARDRLVAALWYTFASDEFHFTSFFDRSTGKLWPVYNAYKHANMLFGGATFLGELQDQQDGVEGYQFRNGRATVTIFWSDQSARQATIAVPAGSRLRCTDRDGTPLSCQNVNGVVTLPATPESYYVVSP